MYSFKLEVDLLKQAKNCLNGVLTCVMIIHVKTSKSKKNCSSVLSDQPPAFIGKCMFINLNTTSRAQSIQSKS